VPPLKGNFLAAVDEPEKKKGKRKGKKGKGGRELNVTALIIYTHKKYLSSYAIFSI